MFRLWELDQASKDGGVPVVGQLERVFEEGHWQETSGAKVESDNLVSAVLLEVATVEVRWTQA